MNETNGSPPVSNPHPNMVPTVPAALRVIGSRISSEQFIGDVLQLLGTGANVEIAVKINRRPEGDYRCTVKSCAVALKRQHICLTRLAP